MTTESQGWSGSCFMAASFFYPQKMMDWKTRNDPKSVVLSGTIHFPKWWDIFLKMRHLEDFNVKTHHSESHSQLFSDWHFPITRILPLTPSEPGHDNLWSCSSELRTPHDVQRDGNNASRGKRQVLLSTPKEDKVTWGVAEWRLLSTCFLAFGFMVFSLQMKLFSWGHVVSSGDHQGSKLQMLNFSGPPPFQRILFSWCLFFRNG